MAESITDEKVRAILLDPSPTSTEIADRHLVSHQTVRLYKRLIGEKPRRVAKKMLENGEVPVLWIGKVCGGRFSPEQVAEIRAASGSSSEIAKRYGCSSALIRMIKIGKAYAKV